MFHLCLLLHCELWHACAGPLTSLLKREVLVSTSHKDTLSRLPHLHHFHVWRWPILVSNPRSSAGCKCLANKENDEVYTQLTLLLQPEDYSQQRPSQELMAKDLHGVQWRFRHIYRDTINVSHAAIYVLRDGVFLLAKRI